MISSGSYEMYEGLRL